jgi:branched-chain amino acid transport system permease protein
MSGLVGWVARHPVLSFFVFFAVFPWVVPYRSLATQVLIYGLFALGFNLLYGYTGLLSFGSAAYWGLGAYGAGIALAKLKIASLWGALGIGLAAAGLGGAIIGFFCLRRRGIYFAMLTLAFAQLLYFIAFHAADLTGGDDGLRGITVPPIRLPGLTLPLDDSLTFYYLTLVLVGLAVAALKRILDSPFGAVLQAIRENSDRAAACGYDINRIKWLSFVFYSLFIGLAGALDALRLTVVPVEAFYWTTSGQVVMMTLLGGAGTFFGPFVGALTFLILEDRISVFTESWPLIVGAIFILFVIFLPKGIWGTLLQRIRVGGKEPSGEPAPEPSFARRT